MKILIPLLSFEKSGGVKVLSNLANNWSAKGHNITIITPSSNSTPYYPLINCLIINLDKKGYPLNENNPQNSAMGTFSKLLAIYLYIKRNNTKFDAIIANFSLTAYPVYLGGNKNSFYYIQAYEPEFSNELKNNIKGSIFKYFSWFSYFLPIKKIVNADMYTAYKNIKTNHVVFPGIDLNTYTPRKRQYKHSSNNFLVGCIGRTEEWKGSNDVGEAIRILHASGYENIQLAVAFNKIKYEKHQLIMPDGDFNLSNFYRSLDILVTPGHIQLNAIHYPVIEAMATKTPLITTGYYPSNAYNSYIVPVKSPEAIAHKIIEIMNDYNVAITKAEKAHREIEQFSWEIISDKFISILEKNNEK